MKNSIEYFEDLRILLNLKRHPVGIKYLYNESEFEEENTETIKNLMPYCTLVRNASRGKSFKVKAENFACLSSARALGLLENEEDVKLGKIHYNMKLYDTLETSKKVNDDMIYSKKRTHGVLIKSLFEYRENDPDIVIIVTDPYNIMRITQGYAYYFGQIKNMKFTGLQAICQECTSYPFEAQQLNVSVLCSGTRKVAQWEGGEMAIGIPYKFLEQIVDGIVKTVNPMESDEKKKIIDEKQKDREEIVKIEYNNNYYKNSYRGLRGLKNKIN